MGLIVRLLLPLLFLFSYVVADGDVQYLIDTGQIEQCFVGNWQLQLTDKGLRSLKGIENVPRAESIVFIDLSGNQIKHFTGDLFKRFTNLTQLWLNNNQLDNMAGFTELVNLRELHLSGNKLRVLDMQMLQSLPMLYVLNLGFNQIELIKPNYQGTLDHLEVLFLNNNKLNSLPSCAFAACSNLQALYLHDNAIKLLQSNCFKGLRNLRLLYLYNNMLTSLPAYIFSDLQNLHVLYLRNNAIGQLEAGWDYELGQLTILDLLDNKLEGVVKK